MPIYEYICSKCKRQFELLIRGDDKPVCPECGGGDLEKQWSVPAAHTNGTPSSCPTGDTGGCPSGGCCGGGTCPGMGQWG